MARARWQRFVLSPRFDAAIGVEGGRFCTGPADDDGVVCTRKLSLELAFEIIRQQLELQNAAEFQRIEPALDALLVAVCEALSSSGQAN